jgi:hypothetical protein
MVNVSLVTYNNHFYYLYNNYIYSSLNLTRLFPYTPSEVELLPIIQDLSLYTNLTSYPALLILSDNYAPLYYIITSFNNNILIWGQEFATLRNYKITDVVNIKFPDISRIIYDEDYQILPELNSPPIDQHLISSLIKDPAVIPILFVNVHSDEPIGYDQNINALQVYNNLINQLYESPILAKNNNRTGDFISFSDAIDLISHNQIQSYIVDPTIQDLDVPRPPNIIITLLSKDGHIYLVKAQYDQQTQQIFPPP